MKFEPARVQPATPTEGPRSSVCGRCEEVCDERSSSSAVHSRRFTHVNHVTHVQRSRRSRRMQCAKRSTGGGMARASHSLSFPGRCSASYRMNCTHSVTPRRSTSTDGPARDVRCCVRGRIRGRGAADEAQSLSRQHVRFIRFASGERGAGGAHSGQGLVHGAAQRFAVGKVHRCRIRVIRLSGLAIGSPERGDRT